MSKVVLITGASRGIGAKTAVYFASQGYDVAINYLKSDEYAKNVYDKVLTFGVRACSVKCDVSVKDDVRKMIEKINCELGSIDVLVNNAGISEQKLFLDITESDWNKMFSVNVGGMYNTISAVLPDMIHRKCGSIVNVSSMWGEIGASCEVHYSAAKAAIIGATKALAKELGPSNIRVNCVAPGLIDTEMNKNLTKDDINALKEETPLMKIGTCEDVAKSIFFLASDELSAFTTGQILGVSGGFVI